MIDLILKYSLNFQKDAYISSTMKKIQLLSSNLILILFEKARSIHFKVPASLDKILENILNDFIDFV